MNNIFADRIELQVDFSNTDLYNTSRGAIFKDEDINLFNYAIENGIITIEKYMLAKDIHSDILLDIVDSKEKIIYFLIAKMKNYPQENEHVIAPFIYLLNKINPDFVANYKITSEPMIADDIQVGYQFEKSNAFSRIYIKSANMVFNSTNDSIENLIDTLCLNDINIYIIDVEKQYSKSQDIVAYRLIPQPKLKEIREKIQDEFRMKIIDI
ncbi:hypothetical protein [Clostridium sp. BNL1100]|uniref:hypothetical protein n=1 Tax=Clostridium sp. BNL1100 TaxID=755731 RepID=UPI00024A7AA6|nr:hypothetical protein [Clostridium sp. BNL1100]AEY66622.1 hypothetical protein Clo1100_2452 [Clostridium sp. BNL1100]